MGKTNLEHYLEEKKPHRVDLGPVRFLTENLKRPPIFK